MSKIENFAAISTASLDYQVFKKAMVNATKVIEKRNIVPVLSTVLVNATTNGAYVIATDLDICTTTFVPGAMTGDFVAVIDAGKLKSTMDKVKDCDTINLTMQDGALSAMIGKLKLNLKQEHTEADFPKSGAFREKLKATETFMSMPSSKLAHILGKVEFAISTEETRYYLNGVYMHVESSSGLPMLTFVTTDGHRLARYQIDAIDGADSIPEGGVIIPRKTIGELRRLLTRKGCPEETLITVTDTGIQFSIGEDEVLESKLVDGTFPTYQRVIPQNNDHRIVIDPDAVIDGVKQASAVLTGGGSVKLTLSEGNMRLSCSDADFGVASIDIEVDNEQPLEVGFNTTYLTTICGKVEGKATMIFDGAGAPVIIKGDEEEALFVLMPTRV